MTIIVPEDVVETLSPTAILAQFIKESEEAKAAGKLLWSPPELVEPQEIEPAAGTTFSSTAATVEGRDGKVKMPATTRKRGFTMEKFGNLNLIGGEVNLTGGTLTEVPVRTGKTSKKFHVEGLLMNGGGASKDLLDHSGTSGVGPFSLFPDLTIERSRGENIHGTSAGEHADLVQPQGSIGKIRIWLYTGYSQYQGIYTPPEKPMSDLFMDYANFGYEEGGDPVTYLLWFLRKVGEANQVASRNVYLGKNVYVTPREGQTLSENCVWPPKGAVDTEGNPVGAEEFEIEGVKAIKWPPAARIYGYVKKGPPPGGDWVPKANCGIGYATPGYFGGKL